MAGRSWKDLKRRGLQASSVNHFPKIEKGKLLEQVSSHNPKLRSLLEKRKELEGRFHSLISGGEHLEPRDAARFNVPTFAQRQAQEREWERKREHRYRRNLELRRQGRTDKRRRSAEPSEVSQWQARRDAPSLGGVDRWLAQRDRDRQSLREQARDRLAPLDNVANVGRGLRRPMGDLDRQLDEMDRKLAAEGVSDSERDDIRRALSTDKLQQAGLKKMNKYSTMAEAPRRAAEKLNNEWRGRQQQISGAMDCFGPYVRRSRRRLSTATGGSGDLFERMARNRERALTRRKERREQEERDEARRERALRRRRAKDRFL